MIAREYGYKAKPATFPLPPASRGAASSTARGARRDFDLPPWTPLEDGLKATAEFFRSRHRG